MRSGNSKKQRADIATGEEAFAMFEAMCCAKPGTWFSSTSTDRQMTVHLMWYAAWWLCVTESKKDGIIASLGTDLSHCTAVGRAKTVRDAKEALTELIATDDGDVDVIQASGSLEDARERMRAIIETRKRELYGLQ